MTKRDTEDVLPLPVAERLLKEASAILAECRRKGNMRDSVTALSRVTEAEFNMVRSVAAAKKPEEYTLSPAEATAQLRAMVEGAPAGVQHQIMQDIRARFPHWMNEEEEAD